ncbi:MAG: DNA repair protein RadA [Myxococcales bacterium]|nr:DNA repair protein RadA [Myxococcales bacterium]
MAKPRSQFSCQSCGYASPKWLGRCPECGGWNTLVEEAVSIPGRSTALAGALTGEAPVSLADVPTDDAPRVKTGIGELDRVLGGGLVPGSLVLLGGDPGIGKSTLLLQALQGIAAPQHGKPRTVLYVSGEESVRQTALRAQRLGARAPSLLVLAETRLERILDEATRLAPVVLAVDSIQTVHSPGLESVPGSLGQVREAAGRLLSFAKERGVATVLVGHVTKEGGLAGPKTLEHVVDAVVHFEGEPGHPCRILRAAKNRFGSTNEVGVFEMHAEGLREVQNPSALFLAERPVGVPGSAVIASVEGSRPLLVEVQALVAAAAGMPRRAALGVDPNRVSLLLAVIERRAGIGMLGQDVFVNVAGGIRLSEPAADLGIVAAAASSATRRPIEGRTICFGEVGLAGEVRAVAQPELRLAEAAKLGFRRCVLPELNRARLIGTFDLELVGVRDVEAALAALLVAPVRR